jgi:DNA-directed RNA polymerase subunit L
VDEMDRKEMIKKLGEHLGVEPKYLGVPTFNYEIKTDQEVYTIDRLGIITRSSGETITIEEILSQSEIKKSLYQDPDRLQVKIEFEDHTATSLKNIINMFYSKQHLIMMSFQTEEHFMDDDFIQELNKEEINDLEELKASIEKLGRDKCSGFQINFEQETFGFYLHGSSLSPERDKAFKDLCVLISEYSKTLNRASFKQAQDDNPKYTLRTWLIRIGMNGPKHKESRKTLLKHLEGSSAFRKVGDKDEA